MDSLTFTINFKDLNEDLNDNEDELKGFIGNLQLLLKFLMNANPNYYLIGNMLNDQLDKQVKQHEKEVTDPVYQMRSKFCEIFDEADLGFTAWDIDERHGDEPVPGFFDAWDNFLHQIGEAMGPMCYAAWRLSCMFKQAGYKSDWINTCVTYYEEHWEAE